MPVDAVFEATLEDVSKADAPSDVIGRARIEKPGNVPIRFEIPYDTSRIVQSHRYVVRARILSGGKPFFTTDQSYPVLTQGGGKDVSLLPRRASGSGSTSPGAAALGTLPATFTGDLPCADCPAIRHQLELFPDTVFFLRMEYLGKGDSAKIDDIGMWAVSTNRDTLVLFGNAAAPVKLAVRDANTLRMLSPHCNQLTGGYTLDGSRLTFGQMAGTLMACPNGMETERAFLDALRQVRTAKVTRQHLDVLDASGKLLARFEARHM